MIPSAIWMFALIALVVGEAVTVGLTFIWFAVGALAGLIFSALGAPIMAQVIVFLVVSTLSLILVRPVAARLLKPGISPTNADRILGQVALVTQTIDNLAQTGQVKLSGQIWSARSEDGQVIPEKTRVRILRIEGVKVIVCME